MDYAAYRESLSLSASWNEPSIVSEAARALPEPVIERYPEIDWRRIRGIGNFLRHEYHKLDTDQLWDIASSKLPEMRPVIVRMLNEMA